MGGIVGRSEEAAAAERDIQGAEIVRGDGVQVWVRLSAGGESTALDFHAALIEVAGFPPGRTLVDGSGGDAGQSLQFRQEAAEECGALISGGVAGDGQSEIADEDVSRVEAGIDVAQAEKLWTSVGRPEIRSITARRIHR